MIRKLVILLIVVIAGMLPFVFATTHSYTATVGSTSNIVISEISTAFSGCSVSGSCTPISNSLNIQNTGNAAPTSGINAAFTTNVSTTYGLVSGGNTIPGTNFQLNNTALAATSSTTEIIASTAVPAGADFNVSAQLSIPAGQASGSYSGTVQLSWTA